MMTSLDMHGFSISILPLNPKNKSHLELPLALPAWPGMNKIAAARLQPLPDGLSPIKPIPSSNPKTRALLEQCCDLLIAAENDLNILDAKSGDGDTGSTLAGAARAMKGSLDLLPLADLTQLFRAIGDELSQTMGGSSGVILAIFFGATGDACANGKPIPKALLAALERISQVGGAVKGDRTMIDALEPALQALPDGIARAASQAREGATQTASMGRAKAGRASYVPEENLIGHKDPGAEAVARLFEGLAKSI
jgi:dihydroxyacetone kinase